MKTTRRGSAAVFVLATLFFAAGKIDAQDVPFRPGSGSSTAGRG
ncbi:MAG: hypothetical protein OXH56_12880 [Gemmatimonadetes bacterium]|nr:hypothetical protein [Gemmatimonadota bacterium]